MAFERPRYQFSLLTLFGWMVLISLFFGLTRLPGPLNIYLAPLYGSCLAGYAGARHPWLAAIAGGAASLVAMLLLSFANTSGRPIAFSGAEGMLVLGACGCFPIGAYLALAVAMATRQHRAGKRFKMQLETLFREIGNPEQPQQPPVSQTDVSPDRKRHRSSP